MHDNTAVKARLLALYEELLPIRARRRHGPCGRDPISIDL
jgi:hypothetical protein